MVVKPSDLKRMIAVNMRLHSVKGTESQIVTVHTRIDNSVQNLLQYIAQIAQCSTSFVNIYHNKKRLGNSDVLYKENIMDGD